ncbi:hypothetical protein CGT81_16405 [Vibrio cholerae]|uniref:hypothetical protein n=1 Tax=Vibrio cholerae TaxID=666 RepID=UPI000BA952CD|nr:hypothetical protein [Vibrio cholerae]PAR95629.1 hypothetical protein CGT81_16405 [Vibrio cholerae]
MKNSDMPAMPAWCPNSDQQLYGLTKREMFCLHLGVPETGDPELDEIIKKGNRMKVAANAIGGLMANESSHIRFYKNECETLARYALVNADAVIDAIEKLELETKNPA